MCVFIKCSVLLFVMLNNAILTGCDCTLSLKEDFGSPQPIFIQNGGLLAPNADGSIVVRNAEVMLVACTGHRSLVVIGNDTLRASSVQAHCQSGNIFRVGDWQGAFKDITCSSHPAFTAERTAEECFGNNNIVRVGYKVGQFYTLYEACFDEDHLSTLYVRHVVRPHSYYQSGKRPRFVEAGLFGTVRVSQYYALQHQKDTLNTLLGEDMEKLYLTKKQFLTRGHLAPRADFPLLSAQRATFTYMNAAPQWQRGNAGDWAALEDAVRRRVSTHGAPVTVYTGTFAVSTLPDRQARQREIYLRVDENNNVALPVPIYFYKVLHDQTQKTAIAFVSINSSYYNATQTQDLTFCSDICVGDANYSWLRWRNDGTHSFCCSFSEFAETVPHLKGLDVEKLFY